MKLPSKKTTVSTLTVIALLGALALSLYAAFVTFGWLAKNRQVEGKGMSGKLGGYIFPVLTLWIYDTSSEVTTGTTAGWVKWPETEMSEGSAITTIPATGLKTGSYQLKNLQFGTIDNLVQIKNDNIVYLRFAVTPEAAGDPFTLWVQTQTKENEEGGAYPFTIYDNSNPPTAVGTTGTTKQLYEDVLTIIEGDTGEGSEEETASGTESETETAAANGKPLFRFFYARSESKYDDPAVFNENLEFVEDESFSYTPEGTSTYYVYVKIQPDLTTFAKIAEPLTKYGYMPCFILYDFNIFYTVKAVE